MGVMDSAAARRVLHAVRELMDENRDYLIEIDSVIGDGDLGLTMTRAFAAADDVPADAGDTDVGGLFVRAGTAMARAAPSTMGTLLATGFMRGGKAVRGREALNAADAAVFFRAFADGVMQRGRSSPGEKTIVDVLDPAASAAAADAENTDMAALASAMLKAAEEGVEAARGMTAQHGKAAVYREQTIGKPDPGAAAGLLVIRGFAQVMVQL